jgi:hypothetical protein
MDMLRRNAILPQGDGTTRRGFDARGHTDPTGYLHPLITRVEDIVPKEYSQYYITDQEANHLFRHI